MPWARVRKKITIFNNTNGTIWVAIQAGFQNPDPWLQALFAIIKNLSRKPTFPECIPITPADIPVGGHLRVTVPWDWSFKVTWISMSTGSMAVA